MVLQGHLTSKNPYISTTRVSIANKFHKMMIYLDGLPFKVTWSFDHVILQGQVGQVTNESNCLQYQNLYGYQNWQDCDLPW